MLAVWGGYPVSTINTLAEGIPSKLFTTLNRRPDLGIKALEKKSRAMQEAAVALREAQLIIAGLISEGTTFGHIEAAHSWVSRNS